MATAAGSAGRTGQGPRATRFPLSLPLRYRRPGEPEWHEGLTENISRSGVLFRAQDVLEPKTPVELTVLLPAGTFGAGAVVNCGGYIVRTVQPTAPEMLPGFAAAISDYSLQAQMRAAMEPRPHTEHGLRLMVQQLPVILWTTDRDLRITSTAGAGLQALHLTPTEVVGVHLASFLQIAEPDTEAVRAHTRALRGESVAFEVQWGGRVFQAHVEPRLGPQGEVEGTMGMALDITERRQLERQLLQAQKMEAIGQLAGGVAHDFNNLMAIVIGYTDLLMDELDPNSSQMKHVKEIRKAGDRAVALTRQLMAFSRKQVMAPKVLDLNQVVADTDRMLRRIIGEDIDLVVIAEPELWNVRTDPGQMEQVIMNLAVNARDAMPGGGKLTIETANVELGEADAAQHVTMKPGSYVMLAVSDNGIGMSPETQARIFEPFFTTKEKGKGTGLGLATVYGIVKQTGGYIWVYSEVGKGTTFKIYLPRVAEPVEKSDRPSGVWKAIEPPRGTETVLLVEDEESVRKLARKCLEEQGYTVLEAANSNQALEICDRYDQTIHLLMTDVIMPGLDGRQLARRVNARRPEIRVLYVSGYTENTIVHRGVLDAGIAFLQKPFRPLDLAVKVREVLDEPKDKQN
ncbi:MAG TPA: ATP-binding protein [Terriglobales bacterium]|nr:ATP-binding protein [Terriglobales bacterium]